MKKRLFCLLCLACLLTVILPVSFSEAASAKLGSLGKTLSEMKPSKKTDKLTAKNSVLLNDVDIEAQYEAAYSKPKLKKLCTNAELRDMACIIFAEANGKGFDAKVAVANVVINRMNDTKDWGHVNTIHDVIYDRRWGVQFSPIVDGSLKSAYNIYDTLNDGNLAEWKVTAMKDCIAAAEAAFRGYKVVPDDFMYFNGKVDINVKKCLENGWGFIVLDRHIYFVEKKYSKTIAE